MFFTLENRLTPIDINNIDENVLTIGYVTPDELEQFGRDFGFARSSIAACKAANKYFRSDVEVYEDYTFTELKIVNTVDLQSQACIALYIKKNMIILVDVADADGSIKQKFEAALNRYPATNTTLEKIIYAFLDALIVNDFKFIEDMGNDITELEADVLKDNTDDDFSLDLLQLKKELLTMHNYYEQLLDFTEALEENENDIFDSEDLMYISNVANKIIRLREDADSLSNSINHLQDAYSAFLDLKLNQTMKRFTVMTSIFFPLTLIVGWFGMNFKFMPEFEWRYGYVYVIVLSITVVLVLMLVGKKRKWF